MRQREDGGELCRFGPFYVEPDLASLSTLQILISLGKSIMDLASTEEALLLLKAALFFVLSWIKYFFAIAAMSFNLSMLAQYNFPSFDYAAVTKLLQNFQSVLHEWFGPFAVAIQRAQDFFSDAVRMLMLQLSFDLIMPFTGPCYAGFSLYVTLLLLVLAVLIAYMVIQEDLLMKLLTIYRYIPLDLSKTTMLYIAQLGGILLIPVYLLLKACMLFVSRQWSTVFEMLRDESAPAFSFEQFDLYTNASQVCPSIDVARVNYSLWLLALLAIVVFLFVLLPLFLLDVFSWMPITDIESDAIIDKLAHSNKRSDMDAAIHNNASLVQFRATHRAGHNKFKLYYAEYMARTSKELIQAYGIVGYSTRTVYIYASLMAQSMVRSISTLLGWRQRGTYMYPTPTLTPTSRWHCTDVFCVRFNLVWKLQFIKEKLLMRFFNIVVVTFGLWGEPQTLAFDIVERADEFYRFEPSSATKQQQLMSMQGKVIGLFWLCIPGTTLLAYLAETLNRSTLFTLLINKAYLQADFPESERDPNVVWHFHPVLESLLPWHNSKNQKNAGEIIYLSETQFLSELMRFGCTLLEMLSLLCMYLYPDDQRNLVMIALLAAFAQHVVEYNSQLVKTTFDDPLVPPISIEISATTPEHHEPRGLNRKNR
ncbi:hypothetical protein P43SY_010904 [Pythium insidiosum]|uniref:Transmembrane protein n=1 Tax=Pythium insidiosum TaxID=114742 RepID=A0AAD5LTH1_PYTIN|nr:hypothetical protein P43SY_010904 [Pythium insidiosum]